MLTVLNGVKYHLDLYAGRKKAANVPHPLCSFHKNDMVPSSTTRPNFMVITDKVPQVLRIQ